MIKTLNAYTFEIDDTVLAALEIQDQLAAQGGLCDNTIGILTCHKEFVLSGAVQAICDALPFAVLGVSSGSQSNNAVQGILILTLLVLTSDDVTFSTAHSASLLKRPDRLLRQTYSEAASRLDGTPRLAFCFGPLLPQSPGDWFVKALDSISGGLPLFGLLSIDEPADSGECYTIYNGACERDTLALALLGGNLHPRFYMASVGEGGMLSKRPVHVTKSEGNRLIEINGQPLVDFLSRIGLIKSGIINSDLDLLMMVLDYRDGTPPVCKVLVQLDENGHGVCSCDVPEGMNLYIAYLIGPDIVQATTKTVERMAPEFAGRDAMIVATCNTRTVALGCDVFAEHEIVRQAAGHAIPYLMTTAGGEICPYISAAGRVYNRLQNHTLVACLL